MSRLQNSHSQMAIFGSVPSFIIGRLPLTFSGLQNATISRFSQQLRTSAHAGSLALTQAHHLAASPTENHVAEQFVIDAAFSPFLSGEGRGIPGCHGYGITKMIASALY